MIDDDWLELAEHLAMLDPGRPRQASLRKSISTAYYALFHSLAYLCADQLVGWRKPWNVFKPVYRALHHGLAKKYLERAARAEPAGRIAQIGSVFMALQEVRHQVDYDPEPLPFGRKATLDYCARARFAVETIRALSAENKLALAVGLIMRAR